MQLEEFFDYKNKLMEHLLTSETIVNLLNEDVSLENAEELAYTQVFPCELTWYGSPVQEYAVKKSIELLEHPKAVYTTT